MASHASFTMSGKPQRKRVNMSINAGVLIIGSLLWDDRHSRPEWRRNRLDLSGAQPVSAPIRYGRFSENRNTYTMVFSRLCYRHRGLGTAQVVPCVKAIGSPADLLAEASYLAVAEGLQEWTWGAIGILVKPRATIANDILNSWRAYFAKNARACEVFSAHANSETAVLNDGGILRLDWPTRLSRKNLELDLLLATATAPSMNHPGDREKRYARPREIGETYAKQSTPEYFIENVRHDIRTNQDVAIWKAMVRQRPEWVEAFDDIDKRLTAARSQ